MNPTVSIIIPIYNAQANLNRCIDSVLRQDYREFECILVDDGSTDGSGAVCDTYAAEDERIYVIHKENSGVSDSRNIGIGQARGTYLQFLDSDDWITPDATGLLVRAAEEQQCDLVIADFYRVAGERVSHKGDIRDERLLSREEFAACMMEKPADFYYGVLWNKLYRRELVETYHLRMDTEISWCEDFMFNLEYIRHAGSVYALKVPVYYYVKTKGSLVSQGMSISNTIKMKKNVFEYYNRFYKDVFEEKDYEKSRRQVYRFLIDAAGDGVVPPAILPGSIRLGEERTQVSLEAVEGEGFFLDAYRERKLLDRCLETAALRNDLSLEEVRLLLYLTHQHEKCSRKELADFIGVTRASLSMTLQKLTGKGLIQVQDGQSKRDTEEKTPVRQIEISLLPSSDQIMDDLLKVQENYRRMMFDDFSEEELEQYIALAEKVKANIRKALK